MSSKLNNATGPTALFLPLKGVSMIDVEGQPFYGPQEDTVLFDAIRRNISDSVELIEKNTDINDAAFALAMADKLISMLETQ